MAKTLAASHPTTPPPTHPKERKEKKKTAAHLMIVTHLIRVHSLQHSDYSTVLTVFPKLDANEAKILFGMPATCGLHYRNEKKKQKKKHNLPSIHPSIHTIHPSWYTGGCWFTLAPLLPLPNNHCH